MQSNGTIRIAVQRSGRLSDGSINLLKEMGLKFETYKDRLFTRCRNLPFDILFLRDDDIPEYVKDGVADIGIVGSNVLDETGADINRLLALNFGYCALSIAVPEQSEIVSVKDLSGKKIATSYPSILKSYLAEQNIKSGIIVLKGCVEIAPTLNVSDAICDLVSTGSTLRTNRLRVIQTISENQAVMIGSKEMSIKKKACVDNLLMRANAIQKGMKNKYIVFDVPKAGIKKIEEVILGYKASISILSQDSRLANMQTIVSGDDVWTIVEKIKECGGEDLKVFSIDKLII
ncbi:ATP phosphoribosyltransferase [Patescibacteria group bacterium]|nr:ATP phosphoribosyltransferase [Patescibacteria group bacterium]MBU1123792.1 ATP phosphoribosyltransferase [Patescibacteria group bacterium]MBU1911091.1 ATP phosphoribosyltransferase [Patescibacteria group bacterium]